MFGTIRQYMEGKYWRTLDEFIEHVRTALWNYDKRIIVEVVKDTLDFKLWLESDGVLNKHLSLYARHGPGNVNPGMHLIR